jgi:hypothetical protein
MEPNDGGSPVGGNSPVLRSAASLPGAALDKGDILRLGRLTRGRSDGGGSVTPRALSLAGGDVRSSYSSHAEDAFSDCDPPKDSEHSNPEFWDNSAPSSTLHQLNIAHEAQLPARSLTSRVARFAQLFIRTQSSRSSECSSALELPGNVTAPATSVPDDAISHVLNWLSRRRAALKWVLDSRPFEYFIMFIIVANVICLAAMDPLDPESATLRMRVIGYFNDAFTVVFVVEMCARMISEGIFGKNSYFGSNWNRFDALITTLSLADLVSADGSSGFGSVKALRALRGLRALRLISSLKDLRFIVSLLVQCIPMLLNVIALLFFVFLIFGIVAVQLFQGVMRHYCVDDAGKVVNSFRHCAASDPESCGANQTCVLMDENPNNGVQSFDNVPAAMMTLFQLLCLQDVGIVIERVQSGTTAYSVYFFLAFTLVGPVVVLNLFLAVIASSFEKSKNAFGLVSSSPNNENASVTQASTISSADEESTPAVNDFKANEIDGEVSSASTTVMAVPATSSSVSDASMPPFSWPVQRAFAFISNKIRPSNQSKVDAAHSVVPGNSTEAKAVDTYCSVTLNFLALLRLTSRKLVDSQYFGNFMTFVIFLTVLTMAITKSDESDSYYIGLDIANSIYTLCFLFEMILKHFAYGLKKYWFDALNAVDGIIVVLSCIDTFSFLAQVDSVVGGGISVLRAFRLFRIVRAVKLVRYFPSLVQQIKVLQASLAAISSLCFLILLWIIIFAILGMSLFGGKLVDSVTGVAPRLNFDSFFNALLAVFVIFTTEGFPSIFSNCAKGAGFAVAIPFFYVLLFVGTFILFNLFVAIIIEEFRSNKPTSVFVVIPQAAPSELPQLVNDNNSIRARFHAFFSFQDKINLRRRHCTLFYPNGVFCVLSCDNVESSHQNDIAVAALTRMGYCLVGKSLMVLTPSNPIRFWSNTFVLNRYFESVVTFFIMLSTVSLGLNGYELSDDFRRGLDVFDTVN